MDLQIERKARLLASRSYVIKIMSDPTQEDGQCYLAFNPELNGCMAQGSSKDNAISNLEDARFDYIVSLLKDGLEVPPPSFNVVYYYSTGYSPINATSGNVFKVFNNQQKDQDLNQKHQEKSHVIMPC